MAQKLMQRSSPQLRASPGAGNGTTEAFERVRELIAGRHSKAALQMAKDLHKRENSSESETLLVEAYRIRIEDLNNSRMTVEAKALLAIVRERFPQAVPKLAEIEQDLCVLEGRLDGIVAPLANPALGEGEREKIEKFIRQRIDNLPALAAATSLPAEHPLRISASALATALQEVTQGPVDDDLLALPQVARRSPLASWKALVRAIAAYYRWNDDECRKWLEAISRDSVPARLVPALTAMLDGKTGQFSPAQSRLIAAAADRGAALRSTLAALESAFAAKKPQPILYAVRAVMSASAGCEPAIRDRLRQHIGVRCFMQHIPHGAAVGALGGPPKLDAYFYRLMARSLEESGFAEGSAEAVIVWEQFRSEAIREKWFSAGGLEDGVLSLHMAAIVAKLPPDLVAEMEGRELSFDRGGKGKNGGGLPSPDMLYERACQADASTEAFDAWLRYAKKQGTEKAADEVAERWRKARPGEIQPLLHLMESAEKRDALKKSLKYLEEAEALDRLNPAVRRAKARLLVSAALRHLRQHKTHLTSADIELLLSVPEVRPGEVRALAMALRWCCAAVDGNQEAANELAKELIGIIGPVAADLLVLALDRALEHRGRVFAPPFDSRHAAPSELIAGTIRACLLGEWVGLPIPLLLGWAGKLAETIVQPGIAPDPAQLLVVGEAALGDSARELAYAVSVAGLAAGTAHARFLFLRARALPTWMEMRREGCLWAALELARRDRDTELAGKIFDHLRSWRFSPGVERNSLPSELLSEILEEELKLKKYPSGSRALEPRYSDKLVAATAGDCDCPKCRARRGEPVDDWYDEDDEEIWDEDDDEEDFEDAASGIPAAMANILDLLPQDERQQILKAIERGEDPLKVIDRITAAVQRVSPGPFSRANKRKTPSPAPQPNAKNQESAARDQDPRQGSLF